jgi:uncharacterized phage-associated protein
MGIQEHERKLAELILYISQKSVNDVYFGQVKLHKIFFYSDFSAFGLWGKTITNAEYQHLEHGPGVHRMIPVQEALKATGDLALQPTWIFGKTQIRCVNLRQPDLGVFTAAEIALVDEWIDRLKNLSAKEISEKSHATAAWQLTNESDLIDPKSVFISWRQPSEAEVRRGQELARKHGLMA